MRPGRQRELGEDALISCHVVCAIWPSEEANEQHDDDRAAGQQQEGAETFPTERERRH